MRLVTKVTYFIQLICFIPVLPLLLIQAKSTKSSAIQLPIAQGNTIFNTPDSQLSLLHIGESTVAGVGVTELKQGLTQGVINKLNQITQTSISWQVLAQNGATLSQLNQLKACFLEPDILLITIGVNDTSHFTSIKEWRVQIKQCVKRFAGPQTKVFFTQVPNMANFPALPFPLNQFLAIRSQLLDTELKTLCLSFHWHFIEAHLPIQKKWMAIDGYHPNQAGYQIWAEQISLDMAKHI